MSSASLSSSSASLLPILPSSTVDSTTVSTNSVSSSSPSGTLSTFPLYFPYLQCSCGRYSSVSQLYFCTVCTDLKCTHPSCTMETIENGICQRCLRISSPPDILQRKGCPCSQSLTVSSPATVPVPWESLTSNLKQSSLYQNYLLPSVYHPISTSFKHQSLVKKLSSTAAVPLQPFSTNQINEGNHTSFVSPYLGTGLDSSVSSPVPALSIPSTASSTASFLPPPLAPTFLPLCQRRCIRCLQKNQTGLLVSPHPNPFATLINIPTVSSSVPPNSSTGIIPNTTTTAANSVGVWSPSQIYRKYESFSSILPSFSLQFFTKELSTRIRYGTLRIRNPSPYPTVISLSTVPTVTSLLFAVDTVVDTPVSSVSTANTSTENNSTDASIKLASSPSPLLFYIPGTIIDDEDIMGIEISELYTRVQNDFANEQESSSTASSASTSLSWLPPLSEEYSSLSYQLPGSSYHIYSSSTLSTLPSSSSSSSERLKASVIGDIRVAYVRKNISVSTSEKNTEENSEPSITPTISSNRDKNDLSIPFTYTVYLHPRTILEHGGIHSTENKITKVIINAEWIV